MKQDFIEAWLSLKSGSELEQPNRNMSFNTAKNNEVWLSALPLAWQKFHKETQFQVEMPKNKGDHQFAQFLVNSYLGKKIDENDVDDSVYYRAGAKSESANIINKDLEEIFENQAKWTEEEKFKVEKISSVKHDQVVFYGSMYKVLKLAFPFYYIPGKIMHFCKKKVPCYQPMTPQQRKQVHIVKYSGQEDFFLRIDTAKKGEQLFLLMTRSKKTMDEVFEMIRNSSEDLESITKNDVFKIPQLNIKATHVTSELNNAIIRFNKEDKKYFVSQIIESINFRIQGVLQKDNFNQLTMVVPETEAPKLKARRMCLNNPFWVILRYKGCHPFFAMYVNAATDI